MNRAGFTLSVLISAALLMSHGCNRPPVTVAPSVAALDLFAAEGSLFEEGWAAHYARNAKIGHRHTQRFHLDFGEETLDKTVVVDRLELRRFSNINHQELTTVSVTGPGGEIRQQAYRLLTSGSDESAEASVEVLADETAWLTVNGDLENRKRIRWPLEQQGVFGIERSLRQQPMKAGETRQVVTFVPLTNSTARFELAAKRLEEIDVGAKRLTLLRIEAVDLHPNSWRIPSIYWSSDDGTVMKSSESFMHRELVVVDKEVAMARNDVHDVDFGIDTGVRMDEPIIRPDLVREATYRVKLNDLDPAEIFPNEEGQQVASEQPGVAKLKVRRIFRDDPAQVTEPQEPPSDADRLPNSLIQSDHPRIERLASFVTDEDPWTAAVRLEQVLHGRIKEKNYAQIFRSAAEVIEQSEGDCSEHAVLLAALCRAKQIPARVVVGLIYDVNEQSFLYHMWNEVWIRDRWLALDATRGRGGISATYLKLRHSSLANQSPFNVVAPVVYLIDQLEIERVN